jgi:nucleoside-diphosphate-sugar epimerase
LDRRTTDDAERQIVADVRNINRINLDPYTITEVIHLASPVGVRSTSRDDAATYEEIVEASHAVASFARRASSMVLFLSSSEVYGEARTVIDKRAVTKPVSGYARGNLESEQIILNTVQNSVVIRPFNVYGPGQRSEFVVPTIIESLMAGKPFPLVNEGRAVRQLTYVADFVDAVQRVRHTWSQLVGQVLNIAGPEVIAIRDLAHIVGRLLNRPVAFLDVTPEQVGRNPRNEIDVRMVNPTSIDGWQPHIGIEHGLTLTLAAQRYLAELAPMSTLQ